MAGTSSSDQHRGCGERVDLRIEVVRVVDQMELAHAATVELPESNTPPVGAPAEPVPHVEFFLIDPVGRAVD